MSLREQKKQQVRERILGACSDLFRARGFDETSIDEIVRRAGISRQSFFNYFAGKEVVLAELGLRWLREQAEIPRQGARRAGLGGVLAGIRGAVRAQARAIEADRDFMTLVFTRAGLFLPQSAPASALDEKRRLDHTRAIFEAVAELIRAGQANGEIRRQVDPLQAAEVYVSVMMMTVRLWLTGYWETQQSLETRISAAIELIESGLAISPDTPKRAKTSRATTRSGSARSRPRRS